MAKKRKTSIKTTRSTRPDPVTVVWLDERFDKLERQNALILKKLGAGLVSSTLTAEIRKATGLSRFIDRKVPDDNANKKQTGET